MDGLLFDVLPQLVESSSAATGVNLGPLTVRLLQIVQSIHDTSHLLVDVKPDNWMLSHGSSSNKKKKASTTAESIAGRIRMIDLGLVKNFGGPNGHRANEGSSEVQGTPLYSSLNMHSLKTPSRRDDIEALLYLIGDLVLTVSALAQNNKKTAPSESLLPWSHEKSDEAIGKAKEQQVTNRKSKYYKSMPEPAAGILFRLLEKVRAYKYKESPGYDLLCQELSGLRVPLKKTKTTTPKKTTAASKNGTTSATSNRARSRATAKLDDSDTDEEPKKKKSSRYKVQEADLSDVSMEDVEDSKPAAVGDDDSVVSMDVEYSDVEEVPAPAAAAKKTNKKFRGIKLVPKDKQEPTIYLVQGETESMELQDATDDSYAAQVTLSDKHKGVEIVRAGRHKKKCLPTVNRIDVPASGTVAFVGQAIAVGSMEWTVFNLTQAEYKEQTKKKAAPSAKAAAPSSRRARAAMKATDDNVEKEKKTSKKTLLSATFNITTGPHANQEIVLEEGVCESLTIGSAPTGKGEHLVLQGLAANHVRLNLHIKGKTVMVKVTDLAKSNQQTLFNNNPAGKSEMAFRGDVVQLGDDTTLKFVA